MYKLISHIPDLNLRLRKAAHNLLADVSQLSEFMNALSSGGDVFARGAVTPHTALSRLYCLSVQDNRVDQALFWGINSVCFKASGGVHCPDMSAFLQFSFVGLNPIFLNHPPGKSLPTHAFFYGRYSALIDGYVQVQAQFFKRNFDDLPNHRGQTAMMRFSDIWSDLKPLLRGDPTIELVGPGLCYFDRNVAGDNAGAISLQFWELVTLLASQKCTPQALRVLDCDAEVIGFVSRDVVAKHEPILKVFEFLLNKLVVPKSGAVDLLRRSLIKEKSPINILRKVKVEQCSACDHYAATNPDSVDIMIMTQSIFYEFLNQVAAGKIRESWSLFSNIIRTLKENTGRLYVDTRTCGALLGCVVEPRIIMDVFPKIFQAMFPELSYHIGLTLLPTGFSESMDCPLKDEVLICMEGRSPGHSFRSICIRKIPNERSLGS